MPSDPDRGVGARAVPGIDLAKLISVMSVDPIADKVGDKRSDPGRRMLEAVRKRRHPVAAALERLSSCVTEWTGGSLAFAAALLIILAWAVTGPLFHFSDTWQLVINTGTTIVTFLMVFLIQRTQNKDGLAIQLKLNELVAAMHGASNRLIEVEDLSEEEMHLLRNHYRKLVEMARADIDISASHSIEEAESRHARKAGPRPKA